MPDLHPVEHQFDTLLLPWSWCRSCQRAFVKGTYRSVRVAATLRHPQRSLLRLCPYQDCWGHILRDSCPWATIRENHPDYPVEPERHVVYRHRPGGAV